MTSSPLAASRPWRVLLLDTKRSNPNHYLYLALRDALAAHPAVEHVAAASYADVVRRAADERCNLFIAFDGEQLHRETCARAAARCGRSLLWVTEDPYEVGVNLANADLFDLVFSNDSASVARYGAKGRHLPLAAWPAAHHLPLASDAECRYDLFFAGTAWPNRVALLQRMQHELSGLKLKLALPHNEHLPPPDLALPPSAYGWRTPNNQFARFANRSRVVLSLHREFTAAVDGAPMAATPGPRLFEVALAGGFQLVDLALDETRRYFDEGREFVGFHNEREAIDQLRHYLAHPDQRLAIAAAAQTKALALHTYQQRVDVLLEAAAGLTPRPLPSVASTPSTQRLRVLHVTHNIVGMPPYGGVEVYQDTMARELVDEVDNYFYVPDRSVHGRTCRLFHYHNGSYEEVEALNFSLPETQDALTCPEREQAFAALLARHAFQVVHFQHFIGQVPSLPFIARALGIPTMMSLHDYYPMCSQFNLIGHDGRFCQAETRSESECDICLARIRDAQAGSQACRRAFYGRLLAHIDVLQANTSEVADRYRAIYPPLRQHPRFIATGLPGNDMPRLPPADVDRRPLRIALLGNFSTNKGGEMLFEVFDALRDAPVRFEVFGQIERVLEAKVALFNFPNVVWHGGYTPGTLGEQLRDIPLSLHSSIWPETYCLALSEAWQAGLVPLVADLGALGLRVQNGVNGFTYAPDRPGTLVDLILALLAEPQRIVAARANITPALWTNLPDHRRWLLDTYRQLAAAAPPTGLIAATPAYDTRLEPTLFDCGIVLNYPLWRRALIAPPIPIQVVPPILRRALNYFRRYGLLVTARRVLFEVRWRLFRR